VASLLKPDFTVLKSDAVTNIAATKSSRYIVAMVFRKPGAVDYESLRATAIVTLKPESLGGPDGDRGGIHTGRTTVQLADRARQYWSLGASRLRPIKPARLVARMKGVGTIIGDWDIDQKNPSTGESFNLVDAENIDPRDIVGMTLNMGNHRLSTTVTWSQDIRDIR